MIKVNILPRLSVVANTLDDVFFPEQAREEIVVRAGVIKNREGEELEFIMGAFTPKDNFNLLILTKNKNNGKWETNTSMGGEFSTPFLEVEAAVNSLK